MTIDVATPVFLTVLVLLVPSLAWMSRKVLDDDTIRIPRTAFYIEAIFLQFILLALAIWMMNEREIVIPLGGDVGTKAVLLMLGSLVVALIAATIGWRYAGDERRRRLVKIAPRTNHDRSLWIVVSVCAGICEEIIFRGAVFELFRQISGGSWWPAAIAGAFVFGLAHLAQGLSSAGIVVVFGLALQSLSAATGGLIGVMILHFLYDLIVGLAVGRSNAVERPNETL